MKCHACGYMQSQPNARFCGQCGVELTAERGPTLPPQPDHLQSTTNVDTLSKALLALATELDQCDFVDKAAASAASMALCGFAVEQNGPRRPSIVVLGEYRRGKTMLINRLLGSQTIPWRRPSPTVPSRVRWSQSSDHGADLQEEFRCDAAILRNVDLLEVSLSMLSPQEFSNDAIGALIDAVGVIFCIDVRQVLSLSERTFLSEVLFPLTRRPIALVLTFANEVEDQAELAEVKSLVDAFVARQNSDRLVAMTLPPVAGHNPRLFELEAWIEATASASSDQGEDRLDRLAQLLDQIEELLATATLPEDVPPEVDLAEAVADRVKSLNSFLDREHRLALAEANSLLREQIARLRSDVPSILSGMGFEAHGREATAHFVRRVRMAASQSAERYLVTLQQSLLEGCSPELVAVANSINSSAGWSSPKFKSSVNVWPQRTGSQRSGSQRGRDWRLAALTGGALAVATFASSWIPVAGAAVALVAINNWRISQRKAAEATSAEATGLAILAWLNEIEPAVIARLQSSADEALKTIRAEVLGMVQREPQAEARPTIDVKWHLDQCRNLIAIRKKGASG